MHGDLDGYHEELKDVGLDDEFYKWKKLSNIMLKKCDLNEWNLPPKVLPKKKTPIKTLNEMWNKLAKSEEERKKADDEIVKKGFY